MQIAFFTYLPLEYGGGVAKYFLQIAPILQKRMPGAQITIISFDEAFLRKILFIYTLYFWGKQDQHRKVKEPTKQIKKELGQVKYIKVHSISSLARVLRTQDIFYTTNNLLELLLLKGISFFQKLPRVIIVFHIPVVYTMATTVHTKFHNLLYTSYLYKKLLPRSWKLHVLNSYVKNHVSRFFPAKNIVFIPTPFRSQFTPRTTMKATKNHFLWVGRLTEQKGIDYLVTIVNEVNEKTKKPVQWTIIGEGEERDKIIALQKKWPNVHYEGYVENKALPEIFAKHDLFIMTSISEAYPYTLLEAQSMKLPVICFDIPGCQDIITNGKTGYVVRSKEQFVKRVVTYAESNKKMTVIPHDTYEERWKGLITLFSKP